MTFVYFEHQGNDEVAQGRMLYFRPEVIRTVVQNASNDPSDGGQCFLLTMEPGLPETAEYVPVVGEAQYHVQRIEAAERAKGL